MRHLCRGTVCVYRSQQLLLCPYNQPVLGPCLRPLRLCAAHPVGKIGLGFIVAAQGPCPDAELPVVVGLWFACCPLEKYVGADAQKPVQLQPEATCTLLGSLVMFGWQHTNV